MSTSGVAPVDEVFAIWTTASAARSGLRATSVRSAPRAASCLAAARPIPLVAPVITTRLPMTPVHSPLIADTLLIVECGAGRQAHARQHDDHGQDRCQRQREWNEH